VTIPWVYLETTMFSVPFADDSPELRADTLKVFDMIRAGKLDPYTSEYVLQEIRDTTNPVLRLKMLDYIARYEVKDLGQSPEAERLAALYIEAKAIPETYSTDAAHIAMTAINGLDFIVSLNFQHIVRPWTIEKVDAINEKEGYKHIGIYKPAEVLEL
jgi:predicted nucleic acid-binding protein